MAPWTQADHQYMREALTLAHSGVGLVSPNPVVGAVLVKDGKVIGRGTHTYEGRTHAEVLALEDAGPGAARGSTLYLNLEPCSHFGRTGPCADAVIAAGISRVICAMQDPNPVVAGKGFARLRAAGIQVEVGLLEEEAKRLNESFAKWIRTGIPFVTLKAGMSLDGKIAPPTHAAHSRWITSEVARTHAQGLRHQADAILVGVGTVLVDDPALTDRTGLPRRRSLLRIVLDRHLRTPTGAQLLKEVRHDVLIATGEQMDIAKAAELSSRGAELTAHATEHFWHAILDALADRNITSLLIEGGAKVYASSLQAGIVDKLALYISPTLVGGEGLSAFDGAATPAQLKHFRAQRIHEDLLITGYLRDPYED